MRLPRCDQTTSSKIVADVLGLVDRVEDRVDRAGADLLAALDEVDELLDDGPRLGDLRVVAVERQPVAAEVDRAAEPLAQRAEHAVADAGELGGDVVRNVENFLHSVSVGGPSAAASSASRAGATRCVAGQRVGMA